MSLIIPMLIMLAAPADREAVAVHSPAEAVALADAASTNGKSGRFEMTVVSTGKNAKATFLNSSDDYRADGDLTFSIAPVVATMLTRRYGMAPEQYFKGKHLVVDGVVRRELVVNELYGRPRSANRWQHTVRIERAAQIVSVS